MQIFSQESTIQNISEFIQKNYALKKIAIFSDNNFLNQDISFQIQKQITNKVIENKPLTEDVAFCLICGNFGFQQESLRKITKCNLPYAYIITDLSQSSFLAPYIQDEKLQLIYNAEFIAFEKQAIKKQNYSCNLATISYLQSVKVQILEKEFYARVFNKNYALDCKEKAISVCESIEGIMQIKHKNLQTANLKIVDAIAKFLKLQSKYNFLQEENIILTFANSLTSCLFSNFYENTFVASIFATSLLEKYFSLSFKNNYSFDYQKSLKYCKKDFNYTVSDFQLSQVDNNLCYKLLFNKEYFLSQIKQISSKLFLNKYDFLSVFDDFGYNLVNVLQQCDIKKCIAEVANCGEENIFKQVRNVGLLDF